LKFKSKTLWRIARRPKKARKAQEGHLEEGNPQKPTKGTKNGKAEQNGKEKLRRVRKAQSQHKSSKSTLPLKSTPPNTLNASSPPYIVIYHVSPLIHPISKSSTNFVPILSPFDNELIKHKPREEWDAMHENQN
jgi:hypothetical protein